MRKIHSAKDSIFAVCLNILMLCLGTVWSSTANAQNTHELFVPFNASDADLNETAKDVYQWWNAHGHPDIYVMISTQYAHPLTKAASAIEAVGRLKAAILAQHIMERVIDARWMRPDQADPGTPPEQLSAIDLMMVDQSNVLHRMPKFSMQEFPPFPGASDQDALNSKAQQFADAAKGLPATPSATCQGLSGTDKVDCLSQRDWFGRGIINRTLPGMR